MKIVIDVFGGDNAPSEIVTGALLALKAESSLKVVLAGDETKIKEELKAIDSKYFLSRIEILHAPEVIGNEESPVAAIKHKKESSIVKGLGVLAEGGADGFVSAGSTGAVLTGATLILKRIKGISRPALAPVLPTVGEKSVILIDCGANVDCKPQQLLHFALMGAAYAKVNGTDNPKIALLNNGAEEGKGNELTKEAYGVLKAADINFIGNLEGRYLLSGETDVLVADGFDGNVALKTAEGVAVSMFKLIKQAVYGGGLKEKIGALLLKPALKGLQKKMDYNENGGACFLGVNKVVVKAHGASKASSISAAILQAAELAEAKLPEKIAFELEKYNKTHSSESGVADAE